MLAYLKFSALGNFFSPYDLNRAGQNRDVREVAAYDQV
jgi:hypothetical protein